MCALHVLYALCVCECACFCARSRANDIINEQVRQQFETCGGVGGNKLVAKIAVNLHKPNGWLVGLVFEMDRHIFYVVAVLLDQLARCPLTWRRLIDLFRHINS